MKEGRTGGAPEGQAILGNSSKCQEQEGKRAKRQEGSYIGIILGLPGGRDAVRERLEAE